MGAGAGSSLQAGMDAIRHHHRSLPRPQPPFAMGLKKSQQYEVSLDRPISAISRELFNFFAKNA